MFFKTPAYDPPAASGRNVDLTALNCAPCSIDPDEIVTLRQWRACLRQVRFSPWLANATLSHLLTNPKYPLYSYLSAQGIDPLADFAALRDQQQAYESDAAMWAAYTEVAFRTGDAHYRWTLPPAYRNADVFVPFRLQPQADGRLTLALDLPADEQPATEEDFDEVLGNYLTAVGIPPDDFGLEYGDLGREVAQVNDENPHVALVGAARDNFEAMPDGNRWSLAASTSLLTHFDNSRGRGLGRMLDGPLDLVLALAPHQDDDDSDWRHVRLPYVARITSDSAYVTAESLERANVNPLVAGGAVAGKTYTELQAFFADPPAPTNYDVRRIDSIGTFVGDSDPVAYDGGLCGDGLCGSGGAAILDVLWQNERMEELVEAPGAPTAPQFFTPQRRAARAARRDAPADEVAAAADGTWAIYQNGGVVHVRIHGPFLRDFSRQAVLNALRDTCFTGTRIVFDFAGNGGGFPQLSNIGVLTAATVDEIPAAYAAMLLSAGPAASAYYTFARSFGNAADPDAPTGPGGQRDYIGSQLRHVEVAGGTVAVNTTAPGLSVVYVDEWDESRRFVAECYRADQVFVAVDGFTVSAAAFQVAVAAHYGFGTPLFLRAPPAGLAEELATELPGGLPLGAPRSPGTAYTVVTPPHSVALTPPGEIVATLNPSPEVAYVWLDGERQADLDDPAAYVANTTVDYACTFPAAPEWDPDTPAGRAAIAQALEDGACGCPTGSCTCASDDGCPAGSYRLAAPFVPEGECALCKVACTGELTTQRRREAIVDACGVCAPSLPAFVEAIADCPCPGVLNEDCPDLVDGDDDDDDDDDDDAGTLPPGVVVPRTNFDLGECTSLDLFDPMALIVDNMYSDAPTLNDACDSPTLKVWDFSNFECARVIRADNEIIRATYVTDFNDTGVLINDSGFAVDVAASTRTYLSYAADAQMGQGVMASYNASDVAGMKAAGLHIDAVSFVLTFVEHAFSPPQAATQLYVEVYPNRRGNRESEAAFDTFWDTVPNPGAAEIIEEEPLARGTIAVDAAIAWRADRGAGALITVPMENPLAVAEIPDDDVDVFGLSIIVRLDRDARAPGGPPANFGLAVDDGAFANNNFGGTMEDGDGNIIPVPGFGRLNELVNYAAFGLEKTVATRMGDVYPSPGFSFELSLAPLLWPVQYLVDAADVCPCPPDKVDCFGNCYGAGEIVDGVCVLPVDCAGELNGPVGTNVCGVCEDDPFVCPGCDGELFSGLVDPQAEAPRVCPGLPLAACGALEVEDWILPNTTVAAACLTPAHVIDRECAVESPELLAGARAAFPLFGVTHPFLAIPLAARWVPPRAGWAARRELDGVLAVVTEVESDDDALTADFCVHEPAVSEDDTLIPRITPLRCATLTFGEIKAQVAAALAGDGECTATLVVALFDATAAPRPDDDNGYFVSFRIDAAAAAAANARLTIAHTEDVDPLLAVDDDGGNDDNGNGDGSNGSNGSNGGNGGNGNGPGQREARDRFGVLFYPRDSMFVRTSDMCRFAGSSQECLHMMPHLYPLLRYVPQREEGCAVEDAPTPWE